MLAIVIPYFKIDFFKETLESLAAQTNKQFHVYIGDDASSNPPIELLKRFQDQFSYTYHRFDSNVGGTSLVKQWNRCLDLVQNETWVQILGDDDVLDVNVVDSFYNNLKKINGLQSKVVRFASIVLNEKSLPISKVYLHPISELGEEFLYRKLNGGTRSSLSEYILEKNTLQKIGFKEFPLAWTSDILAVMEFSTQSTIYTINEAKVNFRLSGKNISSQPDSKEKNNAWFQFYFYILNNYGKKYTNDLIELLLNKIEKTQLNNKKTYHRWLQLFWLYIKFNKYNNFFKLLIRINSRTK